MSVTVYFSSRYCCSWFLLLGVQIFSLLSEICFVAIRPCVAFTCLVSVCTSTWVGVFWGVILSGFVLAKSVFVLWVCDRIIGVLWLPLREGFIFLRTRVQNSWRFSLSACICAFSIFMSSREYRKFQFSWIFSILIPFICVFWKNTWPGSTFSCALCPYLCYSHYLDYQYGSLFPKSLLVMKSLLI